MDGCANGSGLTGWLIGHEGFEAVTAWALHESVGA
jgi:hypothetical protein